MINKKSDKGPSVSIGMNDLTNDSLTFLESEDELLHSFQWKKQQKSVYVYLDISIRIELCYISPEEHKTSLKYDNHFVIAY